MILSEYGWTVCELWICAPSFIFFFDWTFHVNKAWFPQPLSCSFSKIQKKKPSLKTDMNEDNPYFILWHVICGFLELKSTQYKKLVPNALQFTSCKSHDSNQAKNIRLLFFSFSPINLAFWCFCFVFYVVWKISNFNVWTAKHYHQVWLYLKVRSYGPVS